MLSKNHAVAPCRRPGFISLCNAHLTISNLLRQEHGFFSQCFYLFLKMHSLTFS